MLPESPLPDSLYRSLFKVSLDAILITAPDGRILSGNSAACQMFGYSIEELAQIGRAGLVDATDPRLEQAVAERARTGFFRGELTFIRKGGERFPGEVATTIFHAADGMAFTSTIIRDVTARHSIEAELREREELYRDLLHSAFDGHVIHQDGLIVSVNEPYARMFGYTIEELIGKPVIQMTAPEVHATVLKNIRYGVVKPYTTTGIRKDGTRITIESAGRNCRVNGRPARIAAVRDLTERTQLEQQLLRAQRLESIGTLAGGIAHDMNNLLAPILLSVGLLENMPLPKEAKAVTRTIKDCTERGASLIKQVLAFSRGMKGEKTNVNLRHVLTDFRKIIADTFPKNIVLEVDAPADLPLVQADVTQIGQVLMNLSVNARDAMPQGGKLAIRAFSRLIDEQYVTMHQGMTPGRYVVIEVADSGTGMAPQVRERIFEPFFTTKDVGQGTGLGLSTALAIVKSHAGAIEVHSEAGHGSVFRIYLPATAGLEADAQAPVLARPCGRGERILVVEDEAAVRLVTKQTLEASGYGVVLAEDGAQGIEAFVKEPPDLVLTDLTMPILDGFALIATIRRLAPHAKIIAASGADVQSRVTKTAAAGAHFLPKPYTAETLLCRVREVLDDNARGRASNS